MGSIERREYFEYTPGALRLLVEPAHSAKLQVPIRDIIGDKARLLRADVLNVADDHVQIATLAPPRTLETVRGFEARSAERVAKVDVPYDKLILATGSTYAWPIKPQPSSFGLHGRRMAVEVANNQVGDATDILIVGAGPVGVELACEIVGAYPKKHVTIVSNKPVLLPALPQAMGRAAQEWLQARGSTVILNDSVPVKRRGMSRKNTADTADLDDAVVSDDDVAAGDGHSAGDKLKDKTGLRHRGGKQTGDEHGEGGETKTRVLKTAAGVEIRAQAVFVCVGQSAAVGYLEESPMFDGLLVHGLLRVDDQLRVEGFENVYAAGDMIAHASREQKLAHTAELTGMAVAENVVRSLEGASQGQYPQMIAHSSKTPRIVVVSLGKHEAVLRFNGILLTGAIGRRIASVAKNFIEWSKMLQAKRNPLGLWFWFLGDEIALFLNRTIIRPPEGDEPVR